MRVVPRIAQAVTWHRVNLIEQREVSALGQFDAILCRNVLIYFSDRTIEQVVEHLWQALFPHGELLVGASESLLRFNVAFTCEEQGGPFSTESCRNDPGIGGGRLRVRPQGDA